MFADELDTCDIVATEQHGRVHVDVRGDLDMTSAPRLISTVTGLVRKPIRQLTIDCDDVAFLDSAGVRALIVSRNEATDRGIDLAIVNPSASVARVLDMTGLASMLITTEAS